MHKDVSRRKLIQAAGSGLLLVSGLALAGCGSTDAAGANKQQTLQLGYIMAENDPGDLGAKKFKEIVEKRTSGQVQIALQGNSLLGGEQTLWEGMEIGSVDMALTGVGPISFFTPEYAGVQMYYGIRDHDHLDKVFGGEIGNEIETALLKAKGGRVLDWWHRGPRQTTANKPIRTPDDLAGVKIRTPEGRLYLEAWKALGASPTPMALGELFTGLDQGVVDAQENPLALIATNAFDEVQSHVSLTGHQYAPYMLAISDNKWSKLSQENQKILQEAATEAGTYERQVVLDSEEEYKKELQDKGMTIVDDVDVDRFREIMQGTAEKLEADGLWKEGLYQRMVDTK